MIAILIGFLLPRKTAAKAIHPLPLEIFGTKEEILNAKRHPETEPKNPHKPQALILHNLTLIPWALKTSSSLPVMRR